MAWPIVAGAGVGLAGSFLSSRGAADGAQAQLDADAASRELYDSRTGEGIGSLLRLLYGSGAYERAGQLYGTETQERLFGRPAVNPEQRKALEDEQNRLAATLRTYTRTVPGTGRFNDITGVFEGQRSRTIFDERAAAAAGIDLNQLRGRQAEIAGQLSNMDPGATGYFSQESNATAGRGLLSRLTELTNQFDSEGRTLEDKYNADTTQLAGMGDAALQSARGYGSARSAEAERDANRMLTQLNAQQKLRAASSGVGGGTVLSNLMAGNTANVYESLQRAKNQIGDQNLSMQQGVMAGNQNMAAGRLAGLAGLRLDNLTRSQNLRGQPLQTELSVLTSPTMNPYLGQDTTRYFSGVSPTGAFAQSMGNAAAGFGGTLFGIGAANNFGRQQTPGAATPPQNGGG